MIKVIDLFAGPGGLAEGFSSVKDENGNTVFDIGLSIEKDENAYKTLTFRSFYRQFVKTGRTVPKEYYEALKVNDVNKREEAIEELYRKYPDESSGAKAEAQKIELANPDFPNSFIDNKISKVLKGENKWVLIGGPPCQAYSLAGRSRVGGVNEDDKRVFLYREYLRIIAVHHPSVFVMENVKGMLSAKVEATQIFKWIKQDLKNPGVLFPGNDSPKYRIYSLAEKFVSLDNSDPLYKTDKDYLVKTEKYGIPQKRHRVILIGVRDDIKENPEILGEKTPITLESVIGMMPKIRSKLGRSIKESKVVDGRIKRVYQKINDNKITWKGSLENFRREIIHWNGLSESKCESFLNTKFDSFGDEYYKTQNLTIDRNHPLFEWIYDQELEGLINHESRSHLLEDLKRYLFLSIYTQLYNNFPRLHDYKKYSKNLMPDHQSATSGKFNDRFRVQLPNKPATTITSHISKDGHYYIHYDPEQCRSLTVREAARIQTFPDNYLFCGTRTQQFHQVGNAVPPFLAYQLAKIVNSVLNKIE